MKRLFSLARLWAIFVKEFQQMMRDRPTFAMAVGVPIIQLVLFGYAINTDPKGLPTAVVSYDSGPLARSLLATLENTGYFHITHQPDSEAAGDALVADGEVQFLFVIPDDFSRRVVRGEKPAVLISVDATDPSAASNALAAPLDVPVRFGDAGNPVAGVSAQVTAVWAWDCLSPSAWCAP